MPATIEQYAGSAKAVLQGSALPYGYTITLWSTGAMVMSKHGPPKPGSVFLFAAGAIAGFAVMALLLARASASDPVEPTSSDLLATGMTHVAAVGAAVGAAALIAHLASGVVWPLASFVATTAYLVLASLQLAIARRQGRRSSS